MIAALLLIAVQDAPVSAALPAEDEITVIARRLKDWRGKFNIHDGKASCTTTKSTGDAGVDAVGCGALTLCVTRLQDRIVAGADKKLAKMVRKEMGEAVNKDLVTCLNDERPRLIGELADRRAAGQGDGQ